MHVLVITNRADFFQEVQAVCRRLLEQCPVEHGSAEAWELTDLAQLPTEAWLVRDVQAGIPANDGGQLTCGPDAFAVCRWVPRTLADKDAGWEVLSRPELTLRAQQLAVQCRQAHAVPEPEIQEAVLVSSPHVRFTEFRLPTRCTLIPRIRERLLQSIRDFELAPETVRNHFCLALDEALANAFYHGNLELCSQLKEVESARFYQLAAERESAVPWCGRRIRVSELATSFGLWVTIQDDGRGFDVAAALERGSDPEALLSSGRGLLLMQAFADELFFNPTGNQVNLVLYARSPRPAVRGLPHENSGISAAIAIL